MVSATQIGKKRKRNKEYIINSLHLYRWAVNNSKNIDCTH